MNATNATKRTPLPIDAIAGQTYAWCGCGLSQKQPLCDGSHASSGSGQPTTFVAEQTARLFLCACARTDTPPYCDGLNCD